MHLPRLRPAALLLCAASLSLAPPASAQTTYVRTSNGDWTDQAGWSPNGAPGPGDTANLNGRTVTLDADATVGVLLLPSGVTSVLGGSANLVVTDTLRWEAGALTATGTVTVGPHATFRLRGTGQFQMGSGGVLLNQGQMVWEGPRWWGGSGRFVNEGEVEIPIDAEVAASLCFHSGTEAMRNAAGGLIRRTGTGVVYFSCGFNNDGVVRVEEGTFELRGFNNTGGTDTGAYEVAAGATLVFGGGVRTMTAAASVTGTGTVEVRLGGSLTLAGTYDVVTTRLGPSTPRFDLDADATLPVLEMTGGFLGGGGTVTVAESFMWMGGSLDGTGTTVVAPGATLLISDATSKRISGARVLRLEGTGTWGAAVGSLGGTAYAFHNAGTLEMTDGAEVTFIEIVNTGVLSKTGGATTTFHNLRLTNEGVMDIQAGTLNVNGCCIANAAVTDTGTYTVAEGATLLFSGVRTFAPGSVLRGGGTVGVANTALTNRGTIRPGLSPGVLTIDGAYPAPQADGVLEIELGGYAPGSEHDQLVVTGTATLGGVLRVVLLDGFVPSEGDRFLVVSAASVTGAFAALELPDGLEGFVETTSEGLELVIGKVTRTDDPGAGLPVALALHAPAPNPFTVRSTLRYDVPAAQRVRVVVYDLLGREVVVLADGEHPAGRHEASVDGARLPGGMYVVRMTAGGFTRAHRVTLVR